MLSKARNLMGFGRPKNPHSIENLKYLYGILNKNQIVTENNKDLLIETLRSISEILIWGDQNDSGVFDFFLEKQMITFFLHYMKQKYGRYICVQLLQTLNILFENIRHETSLYFLLSNNHINNIILNKFDFSDEEVMAYYISFLKTLSLKLNNHSIHFFFNERVSEFPLYVEALKFFDHPEAMVRIAVRTLSLNVFQVPVQQMQKFIIDKTAECYFSNLVWLIRNHVLDLDICVKNTIDHTKKSSLIDSIDEYIDHLNYLQDIYMLNIQSLSNCLTQQLIRRLFVPVYLNSLIRKDKILIKDRKPHIQPVLGIFLLSHVFSIITYQPLLADLCELIFYTSDETIIDQMCLKGPGNGFDNYLSEPRNLVNYLASIFNNKTEINQISRSNESLNSKKDLKIENENDKEETFVQSDELLSLNITDDEKHRNLSLSPKLSSQFGIIFESLIQYLNTNEYDELNSLICLSFLYTLLNNPSTPSKVIDSIKIKLDNSNELVSGYSEKLMGILIGILSKSVENDFKVRLATLELAIKLIKSMACVGNKSFISDFHMACIEQVRDQSAYALRRSFKTEEMFLDMFEHEYHNFTNQPFSFENLLREWSILLAPTSTPLSGIEFTRRFPCGDTEKLKHSMRTFFLIRNLCLNLTNQIENQLPLTKQEHLVKENDALDLSK
ncbi:unnamed protein product [Brachionus calyciflorus]|uniref:CLEC16A n=1 Tax=Brachionus calyciflorus TaxID=104777 RepID=A0A813TR32_9BILA|nr:unnamed protein product [Brachionus calyciflorus]